MNKIFVVGLLFLLTSCNESSNKVKVDTIKAEVPADQNSFFTDFVKEIELVPLENQKEAYLSDTPDLIVYNSCYYILNNCIFVSNTYYNKNVLLKFDSTGKLIRTIGNHGRGPKEYLRLKNFCISKDTVYIFSSPDFSINKYSLDGDFIEKKTFTCKKYEQALKFGDEYLLYLNFGNEKRDERMVVMNEKGKEISAFLPIKTKASPYFENNCLSVYSENEALIREFYNDTIYSYSSQKGVTPRLIIDFGEKSLPKREYLESPGGRDNIKRMQKKPGANILRYFESEGVIFFEVFESLGYDPYYRYIYAIKNKNSGVIKWFEFDKENKFLRSSFQYFEGNKLYCLVSPVHFDSMSNNFKTCIKNPELLDRITPEDNQVLLIITLK